MAVRRPISREIGWITLSPTVLLCGMLVVDFAVFAGDPLAATRMWGLKNLFTLLEFFSCGASLVLGSSMLLYITYRYLMGTLATSSTRTRNATMYAALGIAVSLAVIFLRSAR